MVAPIIANKLSNLGDSVKLYFKVNRLFALEKDRSLILYYFYF